MTDWLVRIQVRIISNSYCCCRLFDKNKKNTKEISFSSDKKIEG